MAKDVSSVIKILDTVQVKPRIKQMNWKQCVSRHFLVWLLFSAFISLWSNNRLFPVLAHIDMNVNRVVTPSSHCSASCLLYDDKL